MRVGDHEDNLRIYSPRFAWHSLLHVSAKSLGLDFLVVSTFSDQMQASTEINIAEERERWLNVPFRNTVQEQGFYVVLAGKYMNQLYRSQFI